MSFEDFMKEFNKIYIAVNFPDNWTGLRFRGMWSKLLQNCGGIPTKAGPGNWHMNP